MHDITCPHCGTAFTVDEAGYADIVRQVRNEEFGRELHERLALAAQQQAAAVELAEARLAADKDARIAQLSADLKGAQLAQQLAVREAVTAVEKERDALQRDLAAAETQRRLDEATIKEHHSREVELLKGEIALHKAFRARLSTKMLGETLEQHCELSFEQLRATGFQSATFGKDNDASSGSKGDYIFRDCASDGTEYISIMFEMKNEADATATKKRNEDFFRELDKDRREKGCEYAVLVSLLEQESEVFNAGIVDVSHVYPKMYVVRPQFFIPIITLLRNAAQATIEVRTELASVRAQNLDVANFQARLDEFKSSFSKNVSDAAKQYDNAIDAIDAAIRKLEDTKEALRLWAKHLNTANTRSERLSISALTRGNPTMAATFAALEAASAGEGDQLPL
jgi:hypothetical protein